MLTYLEYRTAAIYHAKRDILMRLVRLQEKFLDDAGVDEVSALMEFNLAPLAGRRDIAMLGIIHRTVLGKGPHHFRDHFRGASPGRLIDPRQEICGELVKRSALGLVAVYLPLECKRHKTVKEFQKQLQKHMKEWAKSGREDWPRMYSPRLALSRHPLIAV